MKRYAVIMIALSVVTLSCGLTDHSVEPYSGYLLPYGSQRQYQKKEYWLDTDTNKPLLSVPDSLDSKIQMPDSLIQKGLVVMEKRIEVSEEPDGSTGLNGDIVMGRVSNDYNLFLNLSRVEHGNNSSSWPVLDPKYVASELHYKEGGWHETALGVFHIINGNTVTILDKPLKVGKKWRRATSYYRDDNGVSQEIVNDVKVVSMAEVHVPAGDFEAFKLEVILSWPALNAAYPPSYEYWVPGVGKVLEESNNIQGTLLLASDGTNKNITYLDQSREELVSYLR